LSSVKISVCSRWLNDSIYAHEFIANWKYIADEICICDGGSETEDLSATLSEFEQYKKQGGIFKHSSFTEKVLGKNGGWRNPEGLMSMQLWICALRILIGFA